MIENKQQRLFLILTSVLLVTAFIFLHPVISVQSVRSISDQKFTLLLSEMRAEEFNPEKYWELRERYSPGTFLRDADNTQFHETFRITDLSDVITPLLYYESSRIRSIDGLVPRKLPTLITSFIEEFDGEVLYQSEERALIKVNEKEYVFAFIEPVESMQEVVGLFDYISEERELIQDQKWYHTSYISR